jgi:hypothetical protein
MAPRAAPRAAAPAATLLWRGSWTSPVRGILLALLAATALAALLLASRYELPSLMKGRAGSSSEPDGVPGVCWVSQHTDRSRSASARGGTSCAARPPNLPCATVQVIRTYWGHGTARGGSLERMLRDLQDSKLQKWEPLGVAGGRWGSQGIPPLPSSNHRRSRSWSYPYLPHLYPS